MLGKLIKYEFKATGRIFLPIYLTLVTFALISRITKAIGLERRSTPADISANIDPSGMSLTVPASITTTIYVIYGALMVAMFVITLIMIIQRFYKNLLTDEGYLMFTLPVKPSQHIISKLLVSMVWTIISAIAAFISMIIITYERGNLAFIIGELLSLYHNIIDQLSASAFVLGFEVVLMFLLTLANGILTIYTAIAIGQLFNKHKLLASFGAFIALNTITEIIVLLTSATRLDTIIFRAEYVGAVQTMQLLLAYSIMLTGIIAAVFFAITNYILNRRLNLE